MSIQKRTERASTMQAINERRQRRVLLRSDLGSSPTKKTQAQIAAQRRKMRIPGGGGN
ncbi:MULTISPECIES: hypothetical protein [Hyphomonas]|jgi:hypothetical protein|uniref:hypothetical protein n=1 Tax=Hyphomonas TaxID=85 RepID=UPI003514227D